MIHTRIDPYAELGVSTSAEPEAIAAAFKALALKYHPDRNPGGDGRMKALNEAFAILSDPVKRRQYDRDHGPGPQERKHRPGPTSTPSWTPPPPPKPETRRATVSCAHHPAAPAIGRCGSCGGPVCAICRDVRRRLGGGDLCSSCRVGQLQARVASFVVLLAAGAALWKVTVHPNLLGAIVLAYPGATTPIGMRVWRRAQASRFGGALAARPASARARVALALLRWLTMVILGVAVAPFAMISSGVLLALELRTGCGADGWWRRAVVARWVRLRSVFSALRRRTRGAR